MSTEPSGPSGCCHCRMTDPTQSRAWETGVAEDSPVWGSVLNQCVLWPRANE